MRYKINVSIGELVDKISILEIKLKKIKDINKLKNVKKEFSELVKVFPNYNTVSNFTKLVSVNTKLWNVEDKLRKYELNQKFDEQFIKLARSVYRLNDKRALYKKQINIEYKSEFTEEKQYVKY